MNFTDEALVENFRKTRDSVHFKSLVERYQNRIYNAAYRMLGNEHEAEDVVQETYMKVHNSLDKFRRQSSFAAWIFRINHNVCVDFIRTKHRRKSYQQLTFDPQFMVVESDFTDNQVISQLADDAPCPAQKMIYSEQAELIQKSLEMLPETQRAVLVLHDIEGFSYQEIADIVGTNLGTVRSRLHYGRQKMKDMLKSYFSPVHAGSR